MEDARTQLKAAAALIKAGRKDEANAILREVLDHEPNNPDAWYLFALAAPARSYAVRHLNRTLELDPNHARAQAALQRIKTRVQHPKKRGGRRRWLIAVLVLVIVVVAVVSVLLLTGVV
jgi:predicted Zn-dependent protease